VSRRDAVAYLPSPNWHIATPCHPPYVGPKPACFRGRCRNVVSVQPGNLVLLVAFCGCPWQTIGNLRVSGNRVHGAVVMRRQSLLACVIALGISQVGGEASAQNFGSTGVPRSPAVRMPAPSRGYGSPGQLNPSLTGSRGGPASGGPAAPRTSGGSAAQVRTLAPQTGIGGVSSQTLSRAASGAGVTNNARNRGTFVPGRGNIGRR
jgi:hypothetical protein